MKPQFTNRLKKIFISGVLFSIIVGLGIWYTGISFVPFSWRFSQDTVMLEFQVRQEAERITQVCKNKANDQTAHEKCVAEELANIGERWGISSIGNILNAYQSLNTGYQSYQNCHVLSHRIMNDLALREKGGWEFLLAEVNKEQFDPTRCGGGFLHGILEVRLQEDPDFKINAEAFQKICTDSVKSEVSSSCAHILGHLALVQAFEASGDLDTALESCDGLTGDFLFQCYGGIFMEDSMRTNLSDHGLADLPSRDTHWFESQAKRCDNYADMDILSGCWYDLPEVFAQSHNYNLKKTYNFCESAPNKTARNHCYIRASYIISLVPESLFEASYAKDICALYTPGSEELVTCMQNVVGATLGGSMIFLDRTIDFCSERSNSVKDQCYSMIMGQIARFGGTSESKKILCNKLPEQILPTCFQR